MPTLTDSAAALRALQSALQTALLSNFASLGLQVLLKDDYFTREQRVGGVCVVLEIENDSHSLDRSSGQRPRRALTVKGAIEANGASGALTGAENPIPSDVAALSALKNIVGDNAIEIGDSGLYLPSIEARERTAGSKDEGDLRQNEFRITCIYLPQG